SAVHKGQLLFIAGDQAVLGKAVLNTFTSSPLWLAEHDRAFWLQTEDGDLFRMRATDSKFVKVGNYEVAQQGLSLAGQLVLVTEQGELHWLNSDLMPALQDLGLSPALVKGGQLWISNGQLISNSGQHWQIAGDNEQRPAFIEQQKAGGSVRSMAWWQGRLFVAAAHYGAYQLTYDQTQWAQTHLSAPYAERVGQLLLNDSGLLLVKNDQQKVRRKSTPTASETTLVSGIDPQFVAASGNLLAVSDGRLIRISDGSNQ